MNTKLSGATGSAPPAKSRYQRACHFADSHQLPLLIGRGTVGHRRHAEILRAELLSRMLLGQGHRFHLDFVDVCRHEIDVPTWLQLGLWKNALATDQAFWQQFPPASPADL